MGFSEGANTRSWRTGNQEFISAFPSGTPRQSWLGLGPLLGLGDCLLWDAFCQAWEIQIETPMQSWDPGVPFIVMKLNPAERKTIQYLQIQKLIDSDKCHNVLLFKKEKEQGTHLDSSVAGFRGALMR